MSQLGAFKRRLVETIAWCTPRAAASIASLSLRSRDLQPSSLREAEGHLRCAWKTSPEWSAAVDALAAKRAQLLRRDGQYPDVNSDALVRGRLVLYYPDVSLADGAAWQESQGYFDIDNVPPWDSWVCFIYDELRQRSLDDRLRPEARHGPLDHEASYASYLVSWVPPEYVARVDLALYVNPEQCIGWVDDVDTAFTRQLREVGMLAPLTW
jgi:hypothetical protein